MIHLVNFKLKLGKRLLRQWICSPLCDPVAILDRQAAITDLIENSELMEKSHLLLKRMPDLERLLQKMHIFGSKYRSTVHPDSRASFFEWDRYSKRKICDFLATLEGLKLAQKLHEIFKSVDFK